MGSCFGSEKESELPETLNDRKFTSHIGYTAEYKAPDRSVAVGEPQLNWFTKAYLIASETGCVFMCCLPIINGMCLMLTRFNWFPDPLTKNFRRSEDFLGKFNFLFNRQDCDAKETYERGVSIFQTLSVVSFLMMGFALTLPSELANQEDEQFDPWIWVDPDTFFGKRMISVYRLLVMTSISLGFFGAMLSLLNLMRFVSRTPRQATNFAAVYGVRLTWYPFLLSLSSVGVGIIIVLIYLITSVFWFVFLPWMLLMASLVFFLIAVGIRDTFFSIPAEDVLRNFRELPEDRKGGKNLRKDNDLNSDKDLEEAGDFPCVLDYWKREEKTKYDERQRMIQIKNQSIRERLGKPHQERVEICAVELSDVRSADKDGSDHDSCHNSVLKDADKLV